MRRCLNYIFNRLKYEADIVPVMNVKVFMIYENVFLRQHSDRGTIISFFVVFFVIFLFATKLKSSHVCLQIHWGTIKNFTVVWGGDFQ